MTRDKAPAKPTGESAGTVEAWWVRVGEWNVHLLAARQPAPGTRSVVYLAGFIVGGHSAAPLAAELARTYRTYAPDLPGYAESSGPARTLTQAQQADVIAGLLDALGLHRVDLVANSFAAQIAVEFAVAHPKRLDRLVLIGPGVDSRGRTAMRQLLRFIRNSWEEDAIVPGMLGDFVAAGPRRIVETAWYALRYRMERLVPLIQAETLVVRGEKDMIVPRRWVEEIAALLPRGRVIEVPEYAHGIERIGAPVLAGIIRRFLEEPQDQ
ncbi:MAG: alpha/beta fold hydrolase [Dehalococcoidia bacterium]